MSINKIIYFWGFLDIYEMDFPWLSDVDSEDAEDNDFLLNVPDIQDAHTVPFHSWRSCVILEQRLQLATREKCLLPPTPVMGLKVSQATILI